MRPRLPVACTVLILCSSIAHSQTPRGTTEYLDGRGALTDQRVDEALADFTKATAADDENASYHTARGIALYLLSKPTDAADEIDRAMKLGPTPATRLWGWATSTVLSMPPSDDLDPAARQRAYQQQRRMNFDTRPPFESSEPYARPFIEAATQLATPQNDAARAETQQQLRQFAASYAWNEMSGPKYAGILTDRVKTLYDQKKYVECLSLVDRLRPNNPNDPKLLYYSAGCRMFAGDCESARAEYTQVLKQWPQNVNCFLGRACAAAMMGSMDRANRDLATAATIDSRATEAFRRAIADQLAQGAARVPKGELPDLLAAFKSAVAANQAMPALVDAAEPLMRARAALRFMPAEEFTEERQKLDAAATADPRNADKQAALAEFLVNPTVVRPVRLKGQTGTTRIPVGDADIPHATAAINAALAINPKHINALTQGALAAVASKQADTAIQWVQRAFDAGGSNLDLEKIYLDYYTSQANGLAAQANSLRQPTRHTEIRNGSEYLVTVYPSPADLARADELDKQSDELRRKAAAPLQQFITARQGTLDGYLANAEFMSWRGRYDDAIAAVNAALKLDPWNLDAHEFLVDLCPKIGKMNLAIEHQDLLNNLQNASAGRTLDKVWDVSAQTKYRSARDVIDSAEKIDPCSPYVPAYRAAVASADKNTDELNASVKQALAMEQARQRVNGRALDASYKGQLAIDDVGLPMSLESLWGAALQKDGKHTAAVDQFRLVVIQGQHLAANQLDSPMQSSALPTVENPQNKGWTARQLMTDAAHQAAVAFLSANMPEDSAKALMTWISINGKVDLPQGSMDFGYEIYKKLGPQKSGQYFTQNMMGYYQMRDGQVENQQILQRGDQIQQKYDEKFADLQRRRDELTQKMRQAQSSRDQRQMVDLMNQQRQLDDEYRRLMTQRNQEQMQNMMPGGR